MSPEGSSDEKTAKKLSVLNDLYVDLLGSLVPGLFTVILGCAVLALTFNAMYVPISHVLVSDAIVRPTAYLTETQVSSTASKSTREAAEPRRELAGKDVPSGVRELIGTFHYEVAVITLVSAYVIGLIFFRQDPKRPDESSALLVWMTSSEGDRGGLAIQGKDVKRKFGLFGRVLSGIRPKWFAKKFDIDSQFPYRFLRCYLHARGLAHLEDHIPWCPEKRETIGRRSKMFINLFKVRLQFAAPNSCWDVVRNEAQVRLATSVWYSVNMLAALSFFCLICLVLAFRQSADWDAIRSFYGPGVTSISVMAMCLASRTKLRRCIHYMRVREVVYVLEASHNAARAHPDAFRIEEITTSEVPIDCKACPRKHR